jgi:subtilisin family serine protease
VIVAAAGNDGSRRKFWPAAFPWITAVGALKRDLSDRTKWSNFGPWVDVYARGQGFVNAFAKGRFVADEPPHAGEERDFDYLARWSGTSFAAPLVSGLIAAEISRDHEKSQMAADRVIASGTRLTGTVHGQTLTYRCLLPPGD